MNPLADFLDLDADKQAAPEIFVPPTIGGKPGLILPGGGVSVRQTAMDAGKLMAPHLTLFRQGDSVVELVHGDKSGPKLLPLKDCGLGTRLEEHCILWAWRTGRDGKPVLKQTTMSLDVAKAIVESREFKAALPTINLVSASPVLTPDGKILGPGYNPELGGILVTSRKSIPTVPVGEAVLAIRCLGDDFAFASESDESRFLASIFSAALKSGCHIQGTQPIDVIEANESQSGKGYMGQVVRAVYGEKAALVALQKGGPGSFDELVSAAILTAKPFVNLDNLTGKVASPLLEAIITAREDPVLLRVAYRTPVMYNTSKVCFQMTSNGVETTPDFANRCSIVRIQKQPEGYPFKVYREGDLLKHVEANQPYYLGCIFAIIREWIARGRPNTNESRHDFREWARILDSMVQDILLAGPLMDGHRKAQQRVSDSALTWLRKVAVAITADPMEQVIEHRASDISELCFREGIEIPGAHSPDRAAQTVGTLMGRLFRDKPDNLLEVDGYKVRRITRKESTLLNDHGPVHFYTVNA